MSKATFQAFVEADGRLTYKDVRSHREYLKQFYAGKFVDCSYKLPIRAKTNRQLRTWFGLFAETVLATFEDQGIDTSYIFGLDKPTGIPVDKNLLKNYMYAMCPTYDEHGRQITMRDMDSAQMTIFFEACRNWAASQWGVFCPIPKKEIKEMTPS